MSWSTIILFGVCGFAFMMDGSEATPETVDDALKPLEVFEREVASCGALVSIAWQVLIRLEADLNDAECKTQKPSLPNCPTAVYLRNLGTIYRRLDNAIAYFVRSSLWDGDVQEAGNELVAVLDDIEERGWRL